MLPDVGNSCPRMIFKRVVFPLPLEPMIPILQSLRETYAWYQAHGDI